MRRMTLAPLPEWRHLFSAAHSPPAPDSLLAAPWCLPGDEALWFSRSAWSFAVIAHWRQQLLGVKNLTIWIPDFFCNSALALLREMGASLAFYPLTEQLAPDFCAFESIAADHPPDVVVLVHYFGQPNAAARELSAFCKANGAWLVEDAAHVLMPVPGVGETGDCVLYSPHKHLPIPDGAVLVVREDGPARLPAQAEAMAILHDVSLAVLAGSKSSFVEVVWWLVKRMFQKIGLRGRPSPTSFRTEGKPSVSVAAYSRMSSLAKRLLTGLKDNLGEVANIRKQRATDWRHALARLDPSNSVRPITMIETPYLLGFYATQEDHAPQSFIKLQRVGCPVTTWPDLPPEVLSNEAAHHAAITLRNSRFYVSVQQSLCRAKLFACAERWHITMDNQWAVRPITFSKWERYWQRCNKSNLLQSWQYGAVKERSEGWQAQRLLITNERGHPVGLVQVLTRRLTLLGVVARINRGPLLLINHAAEDETWLKLALIRALLKVARRQRWRVVQIAPELPSSDEADMGLKALGFRKMPLAPWGSGCLSLEGTEQQLLLRLNGKWRNCMRKGEKLGIIVTQHHGDDKELDLLIKSYLGFQAKQDFKGLSEKMIRGLATQQGAAWSFNLFIARNSQSSDDEPLAFLVAIESGTTAIYLIGTSTNEGRQMQASSVLLWNAILSAKRGGCVWFDIGGLSETTNKGIADFKRGLNAEPYLLVGEWRKW